MKELILSLWLGLLWANCAYGEEAQTDNGRTVSEWVKGLADADPFVRRRAARSLGKMGPHAKEAAPSVVRALRDERGDW